MADRYWVGGTGSWSDASNHWAASSGDSGSAGNLPTISDNARFDANSFDASGTITLDISANCKNFDWTGLDSSVWFTSAVQSAYIYGDVSLNSNLNWVFTGTAYTYLKGIDASFYITLSSAYLYCNRLYFDGVNGMWINQDNMYAPLCNVVFNNGTWITNNKTITIGTIDSGTGSGTKGLYLGSSDVILSTMTFRTYGTFIFNSGTSTITINSVWSNALLDYGNRIFYNVIYNAAGNYAGSSILNLQSNPTFNILVVNKCNDPHFRVLIRSNTLGTFRNIIAADVSLANVDFQDISVGGTANWDLSNISGGAGDCGGNTGITFTPSTSCYYVHTSGTCYWSDASKWRTSSGGSTYARVPLTQDDVIFDSSSFTGNSTLTMNVSRIGSLDMSKINQPVTLTFSNAIDCHKNFILNDNVSTNISQTLNMYGRSNKIINTYKKNLNNFRNYLGYLTVMSDMILSTNFITDGPSTVDFNNFNVTCERFYSQFSYTNNNNPTMYLRSGMFELTGVPGGDYLYLPSIVDYGTSTIKINPVSGSNSTALMLRSNANINKFWLSGSHAGTHVFVSGTGITFNELKIDPGRKVQFLDNKTYYIYDKLIASGTNDASIYLGNTNLGSPFILNASSGYTRMQVEHCYIENSSVGPLSRWYAQNSTDLGGNSGWNFKPYSVKPLRIGNKIMNKFVET